MEGPLLPEVDAALNTLTKTFVERDPELARKVVIACTMSEEKQTQLAGRFLNDLIVGLGYWTGMTEDQYVVLQEYEKHRDAGESVGRRIWSGVKAVFFGFWALIFISAAISSLSEFRFDCGHQDCWNHNVFGPLTLLLVWAFRGFFFRNFGIALGRPIKDADY